MYISKKEREDYERRFNGYIMQIIKNQYTRYVKEKIKAERIMSLNDVDNEGVEHIQNVVGDTDICYEDFFTPDELELVFENPAKYKAVKSLTRKEKLAIFLCVILDMKRKDVAEILEVNEDSVRRICRTASEKAQKRMEGEYND